jgi:hypothetical protein
MLKRSLIALLGVALAACGGSKEDTPGDEQALNENKALGMTDVTILYPVPKTPDFFDDMLGPSSEGDRGELLPAAVFAQLAQLPAPPMVAVNGQPSDPQRPLFKDWADSFSLLRIVGIRLDPCFGETTNLGSADCMNTIRLTAQFFTPRNFQTDGRSGIHLIYKISREEFTALAKGMLQLRQAAGIPLEKGLMSTNQAAGIHPTLQAEGLRGTYATGLKTLILKYAGEKTLARIAFCVQDRAAANGGNYYSPGQLADSRWVFGGLEYGGGQTKPASISTLNNYTGLQAIDSQPIPGQRDPIVIQPMVTIPDNILLVLNPTLRGTQVDQAQLDKGRKASFSLQNPLKYTAKTADCASCHMAKQVVPNHPGDANDYHSYTFRLDHSDDQIGPFRMFGYATGNQPIISGRVANETAVVLDYLNTHVLH